MLQIDSMLQKASVSPLLLGRKYEGVLNFSKNGFTLKIIYFFTSPFLQTFCFNVVTTFTLIIASDKMQNAEIQNAHYLVVF